MKAAIRKKYVAPDKIKILELEQPIPKEREVLIKVHATTVNRTDAANLTAKPFIMRFVLGLLRPRKIILGTDFAGEVIKIGKKVKSVKVGDRVFGFIDTGAESQANYLSIDEEKVFPIPENIDFKQAAASLEGAHYAYSTINKVKIEPGQDVFINGATGGIGSALLQFLKPFDVKITATSNPKNIALIKSLGADRVIDYTKEDFTKIDGSYDFIFDTVGKSTFGKCKKMLKKNGIYTSSELGPFAQNIYLPLLTSMLNKKVYFPIPLSFKKTIPYISDQLRSGVFDPVIDREYPFEEISEAYEYVMTGQKTGNVILNFNL